MSSLPVPHQPFGAELQPSGATRFRLWAPGLASVAIGFGRDSGAAGDAPPPVPMEPDGPGWFELVVTDRPAGTRYQFVLPDGTRVPDPASRFQPEDVHGPSEVIDPAAYHWRNAAWAGRPWHEAVLYELHVGAFTQQGTFRAAIEHLDHLLELGVTAIELMPVADFPGARNWGYDGVLLYAPDSSYGRPEDFKAFVDAAHERGIMVLLDVVYNHFGPDGNYLGFYAAPFLTTRHTTPWGAAINLDGPDAGPVREFLIGNALYWLTEYRLDGLRLDAVHALRDESDRHLLSELAERVRAVLPRAHLLLENEANDAPRLVRDARGAPRQYTAQWNDDLHHVLHTAVTGEQQGYYADYEGDTGKLCRAVAEGFAFQGEPQPYSGRHRGTPSAELAPVAFVAFLQNHDQIGNRAFGERLTALAPDRVLRAVTALYLLLPQIPLLFMGEEWGTKRPFPFFCDFHGELAQAVRDGRRAEFARFPEFQDEALRARIPDPSAAETFLCAKLDWNELSDTPHFAWWTFYRQLLAIRRDAVVPLLPGLRGAAATSRVFGAGAIAVTWRTAADGADGARSELSLLANLSGQSVDHDVRQGERVLFQLGDYSDGRLGPWFVRWTLATLTPGGVAR